MNSRTFKKTILPLTQKIYPMVHRMLGETENTNDAVQEIMLKLWSKRKQLSTHPNVTGFVLVTARNHCFDLLKKRKPLYVNGVENESVDPRNTHNDIEWQELNAIIKKLLKTLPENQRIVLALRDLDGLEFAEIATATGLKTEHIRVLLSRARKQISSKLKQIYSYE